MQEPKIYEIRTIVSSLHSSLTSIFFSELRLYSHTGAHMHVSNTHLKLNYYLQSLNKNFEQLLCARYCSRHGRYRQCLFQIITGYLTELNYSAF